MSDEDAEPSGTRRLPTLDKTPGEADAATPPAADAPSPDTADHDRVRRFWSARRVPAALVALVLLAAAGLLLYDVAAVRADRPAMAWRRRLARELATRHLDNPWVLGAAAFAVVLGIWLFVLAVTPGLRQVLPMRPAAPDLRAGLDRAAAALVLRDRAMEVAGVQSVRMTVSRRKAKAHCVSHFRELDEVRADLDTSLGEGLRQLGLAHELRLTVDVRRPKKR
ncbi:DUF6286 domain-containing protein [Streptomyces sp. Je 1-4]|uniref:DUF6286 domain-containing protein n=1 Tax=Streptomyces TaxID=1883 RepID=UPI00140E98FD|nr:MULTISPECIES: DUF6286 domain-containing protein [unclassified Streptomyces]QIK09428.1 hypothetical protein G7Z12_28655 [Streptomyces sp. ID38640]UYB43130.1 DUF6286 domain-containing protein [Streptomyces sp. Je 1-4]UZQ39485.1 DUF6286 domain-containing protein [Streptomyces sp. Je 1-4] [Streptomyces sp. Je 1-4 4N24]UZQ46902.1 DUF6286 domain-containing protein [Streptomyces sp. Je 1-4] [Streptomyces sp. Je 1-4 4N24_ara]